MGKTPASAKDALVLKDQEIAKLRAELSRALKKRKESVSQQAVDLQVQLTDILQREYRKRKLSNEPENTSDKRKRVGLREFTQKAIMLNARLSIACSTNKARDSVRRAPLLREFKDLYGFEFDEAASLQ